MNEGFAVFGVMGECFSLGVRGIIGVRFGMIMWPVLGCVQSDSISWTALDMRYMTMVADFVE